VRFVRLPGSEKGSIVSGQYTSGWERAYSEHAAEGLWSEDAVPCINDIILSLRANGVQSVVDVGCGDGRNLERMVDAGLNASGLDLSPSALSLAANRLRGKSVLFQADAVTLNVVPDDSIDAITCLDVFGQIADTAAMLTTFHRVLTSRGLLALNAYTTADSEYGQGDEIGLNTFHYKDTLFRFFDEEDMRTLLSSWRIDFFERQSWTDPPHGNFRPHEHTHDNWVVIARVVK
jgi:cyclopropane fatty-acyl-phospholipid synthase-like methyltransferase